MAEVFKKKCRFCVDMIDYIDYKDVELIKKFISPYARITSRKRMGTCAHHQRQLSHAIKRLRFLALIPYVR